MDEEMKGSGAMKYFMMAGALAMALVSCESGPEGDYNNSTHVWTTDHGTFGKDPISGNQVDVTKAVTRVYQGQRYYFQSEENARRFDSNPSSYAYSDTRKNNQSTYPDSPAVR
jgi:YHS domain-containing protein